MRTSAVYTVSLIPGVTRVDPVNGAGAPGGALRDVGKNAFVFLSSRLAVELPIGCMLEFTLFHL